ncbi:MAG: hypothetical protein HY343_07555 [Lentisphaerae bacterium]|nr:hypothetical protein [Lentisphaerota bacterium]
MNSRERILAALEGRAADHVPLTTWCFGFPAPPGLEWAVAGRPRPYWYTLRLEHLHTLPHPWTLDDDFRRVLAWRSLGVDDWLDVSVPWSRDAEVVCRDSEEPAGVMDPRYPVMIRDYETPSGALRHAVCRTGEPPGPGWVIQPDHVPLIEDYNIPRGVKHLVAGPEDVPKLKHLYRPPDAAARAWFETRMAKVKAFADREGAPVQAWAGFGMDAVVWFAGTQGAILLALDAPGAFGELMDVITETDVARVELAAATPGVDLICERGWYSSTDFWSPALFDRFVAPHVRTLARAAHARGKKFGYVMTTGVETLGTRLAEAGVDVLYFVDPVQDRCDLARVRETLGGRMTLVGGVNALSLATPDRVRIESEVRAALDTLGPTRRFILHPVDAIFPDTPWAGVELLIAAWRKHAGA